MSYLERSVSARAATLAVGLTLVAYLLILWLMYSLAQDWVKARLPMTKVPMAIQLPKYMPVRSSVRNELHAQLEHTLDVTVPVNQWVSSRFPREISLEADLDTVVDLKALINYQAKVPVDTVFEMMVPVSNPLLPLEFAVKLPLKFEVPVNFQVPVDHPLPVSMTLPVVARIPDPVPVLLQAELQSSVPLKTALRADVVSEAEAHLMFPTSPVELALASADLELAIGDISLVRRSLEYPAVSDERPSTAGAEALIYVYDAAKKPPVMR